MSSIEQMQKGSKLYSACIESLGASPISEPPISAAEFMGGILQLRIGYSSPGAKVFVLGT